MSLISGSQPLYTPSNGGDLALADLDKGVFVLTNPTLGTSIIGHAAPIIFDETKALLYMYNNGTKTVYMRRGLMKLRAAGTNSTTVRFTQCVDVGPRTPTAGAAAINTLVKGGTRGQAGSSVTAYFGAVVIPPASSGRMIVGDWEYRSVIGVITDTYGFAWSNGGSEIMQTPQPAASTSAVVSDITIQYDPVAIPPGFVFTIHQWSASQTVAQSYEPVQFSYIET
jgi:hypothetical protein